MIKANNIIDISSHLERGKQARSKSTNDTHAASIVDMSERRQEMLTHERRQVRRTILSEFIGAFIIVPGRGLTRATIHDISEGGMALDLGSELGTLNSGEEVAMRVYLNNQTYFPFTVRVVNARSIDDEGVIRHGCHFIKGTVNDEALHHFIRFIETVSASLRTDGGDVMVSNLSR
jgi:c-di-GMP-binding flagellar brake protein YcgR